ncbi:MAG: four helix bundle protein [Anaerolineae bacterium]|nr:four helix bundle protein [Anaerolineae bacterium]
MSTVERFEDLRVWQEARQIVGVVYGLTKKLPSSERYGLASQLSRRLHSFIEYLKHTPFKGPKLRESGSAWLLEEPET